MVEFISDDLRASKDGGSMLECCIPNLVRRGPDNPRKLEKGIHKMSVHCASSQHSIEGNTHDILEAQRMDILSRGLESSCTFVVDDSSSKIRAMNLNRSL